ncbi:AER298Cp [Eremothecium gossypii ATCC 10895]|uniref:Ubiquitin-like modifier-activating enzyme ATG7 n=1 Tax=Eremothecium gossypii (strain ATCC 10895 / CBS 109.51 / FGSC 9923 / NRRL Y-1056) TaxID=284811 RepID=ATG7_EREGS|nr:AER298Cp [Eremothecium gossypii ATCC 10895]Q756G8.1 RecName: Full=Ubiquitin-like modifier-activating enzyme ATG7; AltName: Full=ATG12-activating enzyme E1 ATG7; AltName: Full=Autophagy-related protein 7 [Eremothecium gossypii ATCC 10895]AAS52979.1 AER298Cp [Eremothecium gossypii ATCC 10895]AEY97287.1 FAER298Cp [Eremothecium gossypii FDAG1]
MSQSLKFAPPFQSFVDASFFQVFSRLKLDVLRLDSHELPLHAKVDLAGLARGSSISHVFLDSQSFDEATASLPGISLRGSFFNFNTLEEFKRLDKGRFLSEQAQLLWEAGVNGYLDEAAGFFVICFADLKKYRFYYWFATPCFQPETLELKVVKREALTEIDKFSNFIEQNKILCGVLNEETGEVIRASRHELERYSTLVVRDTSNIEHCPTSLVKNFVAVWRHHNPNRSECRVLLLRETCSFSLELSVTGDAMSTSQLKASGWERNVRGLLTPKISELGAIIDPTKLAEQSIDLNLKLMKWRLVPDINLDIVKNCKVLLLGAGTLGCYVARSLLAWGVRKITFVDNGSVSYSNPVRQPLFNFTDCGQPKATSAAAAMKAIFPLVDATGFQLEVPMIGHPLTDEARQKKDYEELRQLIRDHDIVFLLMDSRETRWLPTILGNLESKLVINAALGFDSYLVMRHGNYEQPESSRLGCYFCHDVVAPSDSLTDRTLDEMCTVTRPGVALIAAAYATELAVSVLQHPQGNNAPETSESVLGSVPHQLRGFLPQLSTVKLRTPAYKHCSACSSVIVDAVRENGWEFLREALVDHRIVERLSGLAQVQQETETFLATMEISDDDCFDEIS